MRCCLIYIKWKKRYWMDFRRTNARDSRRLWIGFRQTPADSLAMMEMRKKAKHPIQAKRSRGSGQRTAQSQLLKCAATTASHLRRLLSAAPETRISAGFLLA